MPSLKAPPTDSPASLHSATLVVSFPLGHFAKPSGYLANKHAWQRGPGAHPIKEGAAVFGQLDVELNMN